MEVKHLSELLDNAALARPDHAAVEDEHGRRFTYAELSCAADRLATRMARWGIERGDRVGLWLPKSLEAVAAIHGILRAGASYVPVDPTGPAARAAAIMSASGLKAAVVSAQLAPSLRAAWTSKRAFPRLILVEEKAAALSLTGERSPAARAARPSTDCPLDAEIGEVFADDTPSPLFPQRDKDDLAYVLFTSGSTGEPKGVMLSHENALTFIGWCNRALGPWYDTDRFASHAPFHFDLSVFDLFAACRNRATLVLVGESLGKDPVSLGKFIAKERISVWYSAPTILSLLVQNGGLPSSSAIAPRLVLFAGEVFPVAALKRLRRFGRRPRCGTSTGRPRPTCAPRFRSQRRFRRVSSSRSPSARSALRCGHAWLTSRAATCRQAVWASW